MDYNIGKGETFQTLVMTGRAKVGTLLECVYSNTHYFEEGQDYVVQRSQAGSLAITSTIGQLTTTQSRFVVVPQCSPAEPVELASGHYTPRDEQVGGSHYKDMAIQPSEYIYRNGIGWYEGNAIKYISRYKQKGGIKDIQKAQHYLSLLEEELTQPSL